MQSALPLTRDLVLIGGGHAHALVLKQWGMRPLPGARLTLIDPSPATAYTGMLPGFVAGHYQRESLDIDLVRLARFAGARIILDQVTAFDPDAGRISFDQRAPVRFDVASLDIGATGRLPEIEGFAEHVATAKPLSRFADQWCAFLEAVDQGRAQPRVAVIGAGAAGIELALAAQHRLSANGTPPSVTLLEAEAQAGPDLKPAARRALLAALECAGVGVRTGVCLTSVGPEAIETDQGKIAADFVIGAAGVEAWPLATASPLAVHKGYIRVDAQLRSVSHPHVFAAGDCAHLDQAPRPKAGVFAVRAAPVLADNLRSAIQGEAPRRRFSPQHDYLKLISTGAQSAVAEKHGFALHGPALWRIKNSIDQAFMERLGDLEPMAPPRLGGPLAAGVKALADNARPLCGGCGSKTGRNTLQDGLSQLQPARRNDVLAGRGDDAAVLAAGAREQVLTTDHLRAFIDDPGLFARITAIHALGDIWASGAEPQAALATLILPPLAEPLQAAMVAEIMAAASAVFAEAGADIVGGHTSTGAELSLGFTITGLTDQAVRQGTANPGDILVLTKPLGTGVILAGEMALQAKGRDAAACWASMVRPQAIAAEILAPATTAMTDVTGFGLAGHLLGLLGEMSAQIELAALPVLSGALTLAERGVRSTLFDANRRGAAQIDAPNCALADLMIDPQTAGGLLAAIPAEAHGEVMRAFSAANEPVWEIGQVNPPVLEGAKVIAR